MYMRGDTCILLHVLCGVWWAVLEHCFDLTFDGTNAIASINFSISSRCASLPCLPR